MVAINRLNQVDKLVDEDIIPIWDVSSGRTRAVLASTFKEYIGDVTAGTHVSSGQYSAGTLTLKLTDNTEVSISGWTDLTGIDFRDDDAEVGKFTSVNFKGDGVQVSHSNGELQVEIERSAVAPTLALHFAGIYDSLQDLQDAITSPSSNMQAIVIQPSEKYYHGVGGSWVELAPVGAFHPTYLGTYDTVGDLQSAYPSPSKESLAIVGTTSKAFYIYDGSKWDGLTHTDLPALDARVTDAEGKILTLQNKDAQHDQQLSAVGVDISQLQARPIGVDLENADGSKLSDLTNLKLSGISVADNGDGTYTLQSASRITVANGQDPGSVSLTGNALIFPGDTITADPNDANVIILGRTDRPKFDPSMFQSAVDHGYAEDDQGVKSSKTTDGWWVFKDLKSVGGRPPDSFGDLFVFRNDIDVGNVALKHTFIMAIGQNAKLENKVWFMYRDGVRWTPWFSEQGASQTTIDNLSASVDELKRGNQAVIDEVSKLQTAIGSVYTPGSKAELDKEILAVIEAYHKTHGSGGSGGGGDRPTEVYPRFYAQFSNTTPTDFTAATTSTNAEATLVGNPVVPSRIFISVENDNDEASKVKGFKVNNKLEMTLPHRDIVIGGVKYRAFYTAGAFAEGNMDIKVDFGQGI